MRVGLSSHVAHQLHSPRQGLVLTVTATQAPGNASRQFQSPGVTDCDFRDPMCTTWTHPEYTLNQQDESLWI